MPLSVAIPPYRRILGARLSLLNYFEASGSLNASNVIVGEILVSTTITELETKFWACVQKNGKSMEMMLPSLEFENVLRLAFLISVVEILLLSVPW